MLFRANPVRTGKQKRGEEGIKREEAEENDIQTRAVKGGEGKAKKESIWKKLDGSEIRKW